MEKKINLKSDTNANCVNWTKEKSNEQTFSEETSSLNDGQSEEKKRKLIQYVQYLEEVKEKFIAQNHDNIKERAIINKGFAFQKLLSNVNIPNTMATIKIQMKKKDIELKQLIKNYFGFTELKKNQLEIMLELIKGRDVFVTKPTGSGKSMLYILPCLSMNKMAIVISPLIALMEDQYKKLEEAKIPSVIINSTVDDDDKNLIYELLQKENKLKIIFTTPEQFITAIFQRTLKVLMEKQNIAYVAIDEAHLMYLWKILRPAYLQIGTKRKILKDIPILAVTATATLKTQEEIIRSLEMKNPAIFKETVNRHNIRIQIKDKDPDNRILYKNLTLLIKYQFINVTGIIYVMTVTECIALTKHLKHELIDVEPYYAKLATETKSQNYKKWMDGIVRLIVATTAFGMGIDKSNVRYIIQTSMPLCIEDYLQQIGRIGRDGKPGHAITYYHRNDVESAKQLVTENKFQTGNETEMVLRILHMQDFLESNSECKRKIILEYFGEETKDCSELTGENCDSCKNEKEHRTQDINGIVAQIVGDLRIRENYEMNTYANALKGVIKPDSQSQIVGILQYWSLQEIEKLIRYLSRKQILRQDISKDILTKHIIVKIKLGEKAELFRNEFHSFPTNKYILEQITDIQFAEDATQKRLILEAGRKFVTPPVTENKTNNQSDIPSKRNMRGQF